MPLIKISVHKISLIDMSPRLEYGVLHLQQNSLCFDSATKNMYQHFILSDLSRLAFLIGLQAGPWINASL